MLLPLFSACTVQANGISLEGLCWLPLQSCSPMAFLPLSVMPECSFPLQYVTIWAWHSHMCTCLCAYLFNSLFFNYSVTLEPVHSQHQQCLAWEGNPLNICWINEWMSFNQIGKLNSIQRRFSKVVFFKQIKLWSLAISGKVPPETEIKSCFFFSHCPFGFAWLDNIQLCWTLCKSR